MTKPKRCAEFAEVLLGRSRLELFKKLRDGDLVIVLCPTKRSGIELRIAQQRVRTELDQ